MDGAWPTTEAVGTASCATSPSKPEGGRWSSLGRPAPLPWLPGWPGNSRAGLGLLVDAAGLPSVLGPLETAAVLSGRGEACRLGAGLQGMSARAHSLLGARLSQVLGQKDEWREFL